MFPHLKDNFIDLLTLNAKFHSAEGLREIHLHWFFITWKFQPNNRRW
jgi:hypothetical protein